MHNIRYTVVNNRKDILPECEFFAQQVGDDSYYHGMMHIHDKVVFSTYDEAERKCRELADGGFYYDVAVPFHPSKEYKPSAKCKAIEKKIENLEERCVKYIAEADVHARKSATITCPECGSRLNLKYAFGNSCPVCRTELRSATALKKITDCEKQIRQAKKELHEEHERLKRKNASKEIKWCVKMEVHS